MTIKHIIFDLGGVLLEIDYGQTSRAFRKLGALNFGPFILRVSGILFLMMMTKINLE